MAPNPVLIKFPLTRKMPSIASSLAAVCLLLTSSSSVCAQGSPYGEFNGAYSDTDMRYDMTGHRAEGDIFESSANLGLSIGPELTKGMIPIMVPDDLFAIGTDSHFGKNSLLHIYNQDPTDPFYYGPSSGYREVCIGYRDATAQELFDSTMGRRQVGALASRKITEPVAKTTRQWVWKNHPLNTSRWPLGRMPLKVYIAGTVERAQGGLVSQAIRSALLQWTAASNGVIQYEMTNKFIESDLYFAEMGSDVYGDNYYFSDDDYPDKFHDLAVTDDAFHKGQIDRARVAFRHSSLQLPQTRLQGLCLREVGHALGIIENSYNSHDAMSIHSSDAKHPVTVLSERDKLAMAALYEKVAVPANWLAPIPVASSQPQAASRRQIGLVAVWQLCSLPGGATLGAE